MPRFEERFTVNAPPEAVWAFLLDPKRLAPCIPGCDDLEVVDERTYRLRLTVKVGFLSTRQDVRMEIVEADPPRRLVSEGRGEDSRLGSRVEVRTRWSCRPPVTAPRPSPMRATSRSWAGWARSVTPS